MKGKIEARKVDFSILSLEVTFLQLDWEHWIWDLAAEPPIWDKKWILQGGANFKEFPGEVVPVILKTEEGQGKILL